MLEYAYGHIQMYFYLYYADILQAKVSWQCGNMMYLFRPSLPGIKMNYSRFELKNGFIEFINLSS